MPDSLDDTVYDRKSTSLRENQREFHINFAFSISLAPSLGLESFSPSNGASSSVSCWLVVIIPLKTNMNS